MEMSLDNPYTFLLMIPAIILIAFMIFTTLMAGPKYYKSITQGGSVEVIYTPPDTSFIHQVVIKQPDKFIPIKLNENYFIGIHQDEEDKNCFLISVIEEKEDQKYFLRQKLHTFNGEYHNIKEIADLYAKNYGIKSRRIFQEE